MLRVSVTAALLLALAACGNKEEPAAPATPPADTAASTPAPATPADATPAPATPAPADATPAPAATADAKPADAKPAAAAADCKAEPGSKPVATAAWAKYVPWKSGAAGVKKTASGLEYVVLGSGKASGKSPTKQQEAEVFYEGRLNAGGCAFDSAYARNQSATFPVGAVVPGFSEALTLMKPGDHWLIFLPSKLAYGASPPPGAPIPPNADLVFELELVTIAGFN